MAAVAMRLTGAAEVEAAISAVPARVRSRRFWLAVGEEVKAQTEERFDTGAGPDGKPWPKSWRVKLGLGGGPTLVDSGDMRRSIANNATDDGGEVVVPKIYASTHQFGAVVKPVAKMALRFQLGMKGNKPNFVFTRKATIPARPFLGFSARNIEDIERVAATFVTAGGTS